MERGACVVTDLLGEQSSLTQTCEAALRNKRVVCQIGSESEVGSLTAMKTVFSSCLTKAAKSPLLTGAEACQLSLQIKSIFRRLSKELVPCCRGVKMEAFGMDRRFNYGFQVNVSTAMDI